MKSILMTIVALVLTFSLASAQMKQDSSKKMNSTKMSSQTTADKDYVTLKNGKLTEYKDGKWTDLTTPFTCDDGSKVSTAGVVTKADGTTKTLKEGDKVYKSGHMSGAKSSTAPKPNK